MAFLPVAAIALQAGSQLYAAHQESKAQKRVARAETENARLAELSGALEATSVLRQERMAEGEALAAMAGAAGTTGGSVADMIIAQRVESQMAAMQARYQAAGIAAEHRQNASDARRAARSALMNGIIGAATSVIAGAADMRASARSRAIGDRRRAASLPRANPGKVKVTTTVASGPARRRSVGIGVE